MSSPLTLDDLPGGGGYEPPDTVDDVLDAVEAEGVVQGQSLIAARLLAHYPDTVMFVPDVGWHFYDGTRWRGGGMAEKRIARLVEQTAKRLLRSAADEKSRAIRDDLVRASGRVLNRASEITGVMTFLSLHSSVLVDARELNANPMLLNVQNGTLDLHSGLLRPHDPLDRITKIAGTHYDPEAAAPLWGRFLSEAIPEEGVAESLNRCIGGAGLPGHQREHLLLILTGPGGSGKGTYLRTAMHVFGDYADTAAPDLFVAVRDAHPTAQMDLLGKRLVVGAESDEGRVINAALVKRITGGDDIKARLMGKDFVTFPPSHLAILQTNHLPVIPDADDDGTWRRVRVVRFDHRRDEGEQDTTLGARLQEEAPGILRGFVDGYRDYAARGGIDWPAHVTEATDDYRKDSDWFGQFLSEKFERCSPHVGAVPVGHLFTAWKDWLRDNAPAIAPGRQQDLAGKLARHGLAPEEANQRGMTRVVRGLRSPDRGLGEERA